MKRKFLNQTSLEKEEQECLLRSTTGGEKDHRWNSSGRFSWNET